ncbi:MAG: DUF4160 domain-containing protein [Nitrospirales bacterium]
MPTVLRVGPYRFFFFAGDRNEPSHVHIERDEKIAKFGSNRSGYNEAVASIAWISNRYNQLSR